MTHQEFTLNCPIPLKHYKQVLLGHGSGGRMMNDLLEHLVLPILHGEETTSSPSTDGAILPALSQLTDKLVFTTDSFVVNPLFFPGGDIGSLAIHGTVNDLAMMGAVPKYISVALILEEGLSLDILTKVLLSLKTAANKAGVQIVTGDTKVVEKGHGDQVYINTAGIGVVSKNISLLPTLIKPGDVLLSNGPLGDHGITIMSLRSGMEFGSTLSSDSAPLHELVQHMLGTCPTIHCLRDMTRGGLAAVVNELAVASGTCFVIQEAQVPVRPAVKSACELLGLDVFQVANEGKLLAVVPKESAAYVLATMKKHPLGKDSAIIGKVQSKPNGMVLGKTVIGGERVIDVPAGELLPRIC